MLKAILFDLDDTLIDWSGFTLEWETLESRHLRNVFDYLKLECEFQLYNEEYTRRVRDAWVEARNSLRAPHLGRLLIDSAVAIGAGIDSIDMAGCLEAYGWNMVQDTLLFPEVLDMLQGSRPEDGDRHQFLPPDHGARSRNHGARSGRILPRLPCDSGGCRLSQAAP